MNLNSRSQEPRGSDELWSQGGQMNLIQTCGSRGSVQGGQMNFEPRGSDELGSQGGQMNLGAKGVR
jgi:hypothetical protein